MEGQDSYYDTITYEWTEDKVSRDPLFIPTAVQLDPLSPSTPSILSSSVSSLFSSSVGSNFSSSISSAPSMSSVPSISSPLATYNERTSNIPTSVSPAKAGNKEKKQGLDCMHCPSHFTRPADSVRHCATYHNYVGKNYDCPRPKCHRVGEFGFTRMDHLNEHLRQYHKTRTVPPSSTGNSADVVDMLSERMKTAFELAQTRIDEDVAQQTKTSVDLNAKKPGILELQTHAQRPLQPSRANSQDGMKAAKVMLSRPPSRNVTAPNHDTILLQKPWSATPDTGLTESSVTPTKTQSDASKEVLILATKRDSFSVAKTWVRSTSVLYLLPSLGIKPLVPGHKSNAIFLKVRSGSYSQAYNDLIGEGLRLDPRAENGFSVDVGAFLKQRFAIDQIIRGQDIQRFVDMHPTSIEVTAQGVRSISVFTITWSPSNEPVSSTDMKDVALEKLDAWLRAGNSVNETLSTEKIRFQPKAGKASREPFQNGGQPDRKLLEAMESPKGRIFLTQLEQKIIAFVTESQNHVLKFSIDNSLYGFLAHKLAEYYYLTDFVDNEVNAVRLYRTPATRVPTPLSLIWTRSIQAQTVSMSKRGSMESRLRASDLSVINLNSIENARVRQVSRLKDWQEDVASQTIRDQEHEIEKPPDEVCIADIPLEDQEAPHNFAFGSPRPAGIAVESERMEPRNIPVDTQAAPTSEGSSKAPKEADGDQSAPNDLCLGLEDIETQRRGVDTQNTDSRSCDLTASPEITDASLSGSDETDEGSRISLLFRTQELLEIAMKDFYSLFHYQLRNIRASHVSCAESADSNQCTSSNAAHESSASQSNTSRNGKLCLKRAIEEGCQDSGDGDDLDRKRIKSEPDPEEGTQNPRKFACPFFKYDPKHHCNVGSCTGPGFSSVSRVKEHLYRRHKPPTQCPRCWIEVQNERELEHHLRAQDQCGLRPRPHYVGMSPRKLELVRSKKRYSEDPGEEGRWRDLYRILFPGAEIPCPYYETPSGSLVAESSLSSRSLEVESFQEYTRLQLPLMVETKYEIKILETLQPLESEFKSGLGDTVRICLSELFHSWKQITSSLSSQDEEIGQRQDPREQDTVPNPPTEGNESYKAPPLFPEPLESKPPASDSLSDEISDEICRISSGSDSLDFEYPCICDNFWQIDLSSFQYCEGTDISASKPADSSQESLVIVGGTEGMPPPAEPGSEMPDSTDKNGKGKAQQEDGVDSLRRVCGSCFGYL